MKINKNRLLILADDLTGALDTGVQFAKKDIDVLVHLSPLAAICNEDVPVQVINTDSRHVSPEEASARIKTVADSFKDFTHFYKKTDSCLRGNIGAELQALMDITGVQCLPFVPAYPDLKRITVNGFQYIERKPIHESSMAKDPLNPITESFIPAIIGKQSAIPVRSVPVNSGFSGTGANIDANIGTNTDANIGANTGADTGARGILVFDAQSKDDLKNIAQELHRQQLLKISAGCAGFAEALMEVLPLEKNDTAGKITIPRLPVLIISGSLHPVSINQVKAAINNNIPGINIAGDEITSPSWPGEDKLADSCIQKLREKGICLLGTQAAFGTAKPGDKKNGDFTEISNKIPDILGRKVRKIIDDAGPLHLVIFGGDTLLGITKALGYNCIKPLKEIRSGIVLAKTQTQKDEGFLITKAGAFGEENLIQIILDFLNKDYIND